MKKARASTVARSTRAAPESRRRETRAARAPVIEALTEPALAAPGRLPNLLGVPVHPPGAEPVLRRMGAALRQDFSGVKIEPRSREAAALGVTAFARGEEVHVAPGKYRPETAAGRRILGHELAHVAQQRRGIVRPTGERGEHEVNDEPRFEREAERIGSRAAIGGAAPPAPPAPPPAQPAGGKVVQCMNGAGDDDNPFGKKRALERPFKAGIDGDEARHKRQNLTVEERRKKRQDAAQARRDRAEAQRLLRQQRQAQAGAELAALTATVNADEVAEQAQATAPPNRQNNTLATLRGEYEKAVEHLEDREPAFRTQAAVVTARAKIVAAGQLTTQVMAMDARFAELEITRLDPLQEQLAALQEKQQASEKNGLLLHLTTIYETDIDFWEEIWGTSARLSVDVAVAADVNAVADYANYKPGTQAAPIPIVWYKAPDDYKNVQGHTFADSKPSDNYDYQGPKKLHKLGLIDANRPKVGWKLQKTVSSGERKNQVDFNKALEAAHFNMGNKDGDHTKDLGFGGEDKDNNFWPLNSTINRRAFNGYNSRYVLHYQDTTANRVTARPIGGLIGKWFTVKDFLEANDAAVPTESGKKKAGTAQV